MVNGGVEQGMEAIIETVRAVLINSTDEKTKESSQNYFKEKIKYYGVKVPTVHRISKEYYKQIQYKPKSEIFGLCKELWRSGYIEESFVACNWSYYIHEQYEPSDFQVFEGWINEL